MLVRDVGEKGLVRIVRSEFTNSKAWTGSLDLLDDVATLSGFCDSENELILASSDITYADTHFPPGSPPYLCGWYGAAVNISDIVSKGGTPVSFILGIAVPLNYPLFHFREVLRGFNDCCKRYGVTVIGGDTKYAPALFLAPTILGRCRKNHFVSRMGCVPGDHVFMTGKAGGSHASLQQINKYLGGRMAPTGQYWSLKDVGTSTSIRSHYEKLLKITPDPYIVRELSRLNAVTCSMDISDGIAMSLHELADINGVGFTIFADKVPVSETLLKLNISTGTTTEMALYNGGDFGILFTADGRMDPSELLGQISKRCPDSELFRIGEVVKKDIVLKWGGKTTFLKNAGWEHLKERIEVQGEY